MELPKPFAQRKLPDAQVFGPFIHVDALAANIHRPSTMIGADLLHEKCDAPLCAFVSQSPDPLRLHAACTIARFATADDPIWQAIGRADVNRPERRFQ